MADHPPAPQVASCPPPVRRRRFAVGLLVGLVALLGGLFLLALTPAVQTWLVQRMLRERPELGVTVERIELGLSRSSARNLTFARPGVRITAPRVEADLALLPALFGEVRIRRLEATEWTIDLAAPTTTASAPAAESPALRSRAGFAGLAVLGSPMSDARADSAGPSAAGGLLDQITLPEAFALDAVLLRGKVNGVLAGGERGSAAVEVQGGGLKPGSAGVFEVTAVGTRERGPDRLTFGARVEVGLNSTARIEAIRTNGTLSVQATGLPAGASVALEAGVERAIGLVAGETYTFTVRRERTRWLEARADRRGSGDSLRGTVKVSCNDRDVAPVLPGRPLPEFSLQVDGAFTADRSFQTVEVTGKVSVDAARWERLSPQLAALGPVRLTSDFGVSREGDRIRVASLRTEAMEKAPLLGLELRQPFVWNPASGVVEVADPSADLLTLRLRGVPLAALQSALPGERIDGGMVTGAWSLRASPGGIAVRNTEPLAISRFSVQRASGALLRDVQVEVRPSADFTPRGWQGEAAELVVRGGNLILARGGLRAGRGAGANHAVKVTGAIDLDVPGVLAQPLLGWGDRLRSGSVRVSGSASLGEIRQLAVEVKVTRLQDATGASLPELAAEFRADRDAGGALTLRVPLRLEAAGRVSDLLFAGQLLPDSGGWKVDGQLTGARVFVADARVLAAPWADAPDSAPGAVGGPGAAPSAPAWAGLAGKVAIALGEVVYSPELVAREISGTLSLDQMAVVLETLKGILATGGRVEASGKVSYSPTNGSPTYALEGSVAALELESGPALKAFLPSGGPPAIEGRFDLRSRVSGGASSLSQLPSGLQGDLQMVSRGGVIRALPASYLSAVTSAREQLQRRSEQAGTLGAIAGAIGARLPPSLGGVAARTQQLTARLADLEAVLRLFGEIRFDQLTLDVGVSASLAAALRDLTITSPELRFVGKGALEAVPGQPLWRRPLNVSLAGGARGRSAEALRRVNLLASTVDTLGYAPFSFELALAGSAEGLDASKVIAAVADRVLGVSLSASDVQRLRAGDAGVLLALVSQIK